MASSAVPARSRSRADSGRRVAQRHSPHQPPLPHQHFHCGNTSHQFTCHEKMQVIVAAYRKQLLPKLAHIERRLTRLAVEFGLEFCRIDELAVFCLDANQKILGHLHALEAAVEDESVFRNEYAIGHRDMQHLIERLDALISRREMGGETSPAYTRLIERLRKFQLEFSNLVELQKEMSR